MTYTIPTEVPEQLRAPKERMLAAMVPKEDLIWFFKVVGPENDIESIRSNFQKFVREIKFDASGPRLEELPEGWRRGAEKSMRFASIDVTTAGKQLDISISNLNRRGEWDEQVQMNVNRWRRQLGLDSSESKWAEAEAMEIAAADSTGVWVDLVGAPAAEGRATPPPFAGSGMASTSTASGRPSSPAKPPEADPPLDFERPEGWRDGDRRSMRWAAFSVGPEESAAELTVIPAGGDLRGNVARWLGQIRSGSVPDEVVDQAMEGAQTVDVAGRQGQRFFLTGDDESSGNAIDVTVVPMEGQMSLFVKMTGPVKTVAEQSEAIASFLQSLELKL